MHGYRANFFLFSNMTYFLSAGYNPCYDIVFFLGTWAVLAFTTPMTGKEAVLQPLWIWQGEKAKTPCAVGVAHRCDSGRGCVCNPVLFTCLILDPSRIGNHLPKPPLFPLPKHARNRASTLGWGLYPTSPNKAHTGRHGGLQGATSAWWMLRYPPWFIRSAPPDWKHPQQRQKKASVSWAWVR